MTQSGFMRLGSHAINLVIWPVPDKEIRMRRGYVLKVFAMTIGMGLNALPTSAGQACQDFETTTIVLERNATDGDTEVVFFAKGQDDGLKSLSIRAPGGRKVVAFDADKKGIGIREFVLESAEPPELELVLASFPEGEYELRGKSVAGDCLRGTAVLSHTLAPESEVLTPVEDSVVDRANVLVTWAAVPEAVSYVIEIVNEETENELLVTVPATATSFAVPASWLEADTEHQVVVGVKTQTGNLTNVEIFFFTAAE